MIALSVAWAIEGRAATGLAAASHGGITLQPGVSFRVDVAPLPWLVVGADARMWADISGVGWTVSLQDQAELGVVVESPLPREEVAGSLGLRGLRASSGRWTVDGTVFLGGGVLRSETHLPAEGGGAELEVDPEGYAVSPCLRAGVRGDAATGPLLLGVTVDTVRFTRERAGSTLNIASWRVGLDVGVRFGGAGRAEPGAGR